MNIEWGYIRFERERRLLRHMVSDLLTVSTVFMAQWFAPFVGILSGNVQWVYSAWSDLDSFPGPYLMSVLVSIYWSGVKGLACVQPSFTDRDWGRVSVPKHNRTTCQHPRISVTPLGGYVTPFHGCLAEIDPVADDPLRSNLLIRVQPASTFINLFATHMTRYNPGDTVLTSQLGCDEHTEFLLYAFGILPGVTKVGLRLKFPRCLGTRSAWQVGTLISLTCPPQAW